MTTRAFNSLACNVYNATPGREKLAAGPIGRMFALLGYCAQKKRPEQEPTFDRAALRAFLGVCAGVTLSYKVDRAGYLAVWETRLLDNGARVDGTVLNTFHALNDLTAEDYAEISAGMLTLNEVRSK